MTTSDKIKESLKSADKVQKAVVPMTMKGMKTNDVQGMFEKYKLQIAQALPKHLTPERIIQTATSLVRNNPEIAECSLPSIIGAMVQCSVLGFEPIKELGQFYFVPFNNKKTGMKEVQTIIGYKGLIDLARRSDKLKTIYAHCVYENDVFEYELGLEPKLTHKPAQGDRGELKFVYGVAHFTNGGYAFEVMSKFDVEQIRKKSQAGSSQYSPWNSGFYDEMAKKTVIRRLAKYLPFSIEYRDMATDEKVIKPENFKEGKIDHNALEEIEFQVEQPVSKQAEQIVDKQTGEVKEELFPEK